MSENGTVESAYGRHPRGEESTIEVVGWFKDADSFRSAVKALRAAGFERTDLSVLDSHESLTASKSPLEALKEAYAGMTQEANFIGPITLAGFIAVAAGPVGALVAGSVAAGLTGYALSDVLRDIRATPHTEAFARAAENGAILLWVRAETPAAQAKAVRLMEEHGGQDVHTHERPRTIPDADGSGNASTDDSGNDGAA